MIHISNWAKTGCPQYELIKATAYHSSGFLPSFHIYITKQTSKAVEEQGLATNAT
jgi:hypothetical protein